MSLGKLTNSVDLVRETGLLEQIKYKLRCQGYQIDSISDEKVIYLFYGLVDILFVVKGNNYYLCTMCAEEINNLSNMRRIIPREDESTKFEKTTQLLATINISNINAYLQKGKFRCVKLNVLQSCKYSYFLASVGNMNPYPSFDTEIVYPLRYISNWHNEVHNALLQGVHALYTDEIGYLCQNYLSHQSSLVTGGMLVTKDTDNTVMKIPIWQIKSYEKSDLNPLVSNLLKGVYNYKGHKVTLSRAILEDYYGKNKLYTELESVGVREKYCLEDILCVGMKQRVDYYIKKYNLDISANSISDLIQILESRIKERDKKTPQGNIIHTRVLTPPSQIKGGHRSFYININLDNLEADDLSEIEDVSAILPQEYKYFGISKDYGYVSVDIKSITPDQAMKSGKTEFERQYGEHIAFCSLYSNGVLIKGTRYYNLTVGEQFALTDSIRMGYRENYLSYSEKLRELCKRNNLINPLDEHIQYLFINNLARKRKKSQDLVISELSCCLVSFFNEMASVSMADEALLKELTRLSVARAKHEYNALKSPNVDFSKYIVEDTANGTLVKTDYATFTIKNGVLSDKVQLYFKGRYLCDKALLDRG